MFEIKKITMIYDMEKADKVYALNGFDLNLPDRGLIGIIGPSGSGKSTLMYCLSTLKRPTDGEIFYNNREITSMKSSEREHMRRNYKMSRPNVQKILYKNVQLVCLL